VASNGFVGDLGQPPKVLPYEQMAQGLQ